MTDDLISRAEAIDAVEAICHDTRYYWAIKNLPSAQPEKRTDKRTETHACDLISRQAIMKEFADFVRKSNNSDFAQTPTWNDAVSLIGSMPSAQPEKRTETHSCDCISRQAAIDALDALCDRECEYSKKQRSVMCGACHLGTAFEVIEQLPSAQPERLTDKEQRIFLAAMGREKKVCQEVDRNYTIKPCEESLMSVCREIERKVKGALWT